MEVDIKACLMMLLADLEYELQELGWWQQHVPPLQSLQSEQPFCVDTLEFAQWLQWVFVPRMRSILISDDPLPSQCGIHQMAEVVYRERLSLVTGLLGCLKQIDATITTPHAIH
ncbi:MAG: YqcC family protein [Pseudomonas sp.]|jgi:uncharacterized protein YqcC (DUF446 family)|nr:YqcC family protein [Pseudomonas sp.]